MGVKKIKKIGISLDDKTLKLCDEYADRTSKSRSDFIAKAIREWIFRCKF
ncbi:MAG: ribbon-helix-helix domain-containing protein [Oscillospiraceae bacterium]|jgi:metal-responsive CopG/Arc/MetJ family transcriptional regulator